MGKCETKAAQKRMAGAVAYLAGYMANYAKQTGYEDYRDETLIDDVLYGLGAALGDEYRFASGFELFKAKLCAHLAEQ